MCTGQLVESSMKSIYLFLYGIRAPRCWFSILSVALKNYGFLQSYFDYSLFTLQNHTIVVLVYVDDLIVSGNDPVATRKVKNYLNTRFHIKESGVLKYLLGVEVARNATGVFLCQHRCALDIILETGLLGPNLLVCLWSRIISLH